MHDWYFIDASNGQPCFTPDCGIELSTQPNDGDGSARLAVDNIFEPFKQSMLFSPLGKGRKLKNIKTPNESRSRLNLAPVAGGDAVYRQQQDFSLEALAKRDAQADPFAKAGASAEPPQSGDDDADDDASPEAVAAARQYARWIARDLLVQEMR